MKKVLKYISGLCSLLMIALVSCNTEEDVQPKTGESFIRLIPGQGSDNPVAMTPLADGSILLVSNTIIFEEQVSMNKIRLVKMNTAGEVVLEKSYPSGEENWSAKNISVRNNSILVAGNSSTLNDSTGLLFFKVNLQLDSIGTLQLREPGEIISMNGIGEGDENDILFLASVRDAKGNNKALGSVNYENLSITWVKRDNKRSSPTTSILPFEENQLAWGVQANNYSEIVRTDTSLLQSQSVFVQIPGSSAVQAKSLFAQPQNEMMIFGEANFNTGRKIFFFNTSTGLKGTFAEEGNITLNNAHKVEGAYLLCGAAEIGLAENNTFQKDFLLIKTDESGREMFRKSFGSSNNEELFDAFMIENRIYAVGSTSFGGVNTLLLMKMTNKAELLN